MRLNHRAAQIGGAQHALLLDYGFTTMKVTENTAAYLSESDGYQVTLDAVGHWWIKPEGDREFRGIGFADLEAVLSPDGRMF
jgi:hypothetical protein